MENTIEIWKDISGYEGIYQVSNLGNIKSLKRKGVPQNRVLEPYLYNGGYYRIGLNKNGKTIKYSIHKLVAEAFIPNPDNLLCVDHINTIRTDNNVNNLRWCTHQENMNNEITKINLSDSKIGDKNPFYEKHHSEYSKNKMSETRKIKIIQCDKYGLFIKEWDSAKDAGDKLGIVPTLITRVLKNKRKHTGGYVWRYKEAT